MLLLREDEEEETTTTTRQRATARDEGGKKGKQHKTIKSSRKITLRENIFFGCLGCEWDFSFQHMKGSGDAYRWWWKAREEKIPPRREEEQHMVHLFNVTIKQVILWASLVLLILFFITKSARSATICFRFPNCISFLGLFGFLIWNKLPVPAAVSVFLLLLRQLLVIYHNNLNDCEARIQSKQKLKRFVASGEERHREMVEPPSRDGFDLMNLAPRQVARIQRWSSKVDR